MTIGLTGPTGSGKSEISRYLKEKGFFIIDSDEIVKGLMACYHVVNFQSL